MTASEDARKLWLGDLSPFDTVVVRCESARLLNICRVCYGSGLHRVVGDTPMTYVVLDACIKCKFTDCVEVCPVDCFYEGETMLVINPDECIDCGICEPECPVDAIESDTSAGP